MSCAKCMDYKTHSSDQFTCPKCVQEWVLSTGGPGQYWYKKEERDKENAFVAKLLSKEMEKGYTTLELIISIAILLIMGGFIWIGTHFIMKFW